MNNASNPTRQTNTQRDPNRPPLVNERERERCFLKGRQRRRRKTRSVMNAESRRHRDQKEKEKKNLISSSFVFKGRLSRTGRGPPVDGRFGRKREMVQDGCRARPAAHPAETPQQAGGAATTETDSSRIRPANQIRSSRRSFDLRPFPGQKRKLNTDGRLDIPTVL